jgi:hypothetical protein
MKKGHRRRKALYYGNSLLIGLKRSGRCGGPNDGYHATLWGVKKQKGHRLSKTERLLGDISV